MKKRVYIIGLTILLILVFLTGTSFSASKVIKLKFSTPFIEVEPPALCANHFMDLVEQKTKGQVKFERYYAETLAKHAEHIQLLGSGSVDLVTLVTNYVGKELVLNQLPDYPFYCSNEDALAATIKLTMEIPETKAIFDKEQKKLNIKILYWNSTGGMELISNKKVTSIAELKGSKVNLWGPADPKVWGEFDITPVPVFIADFYESLSRGVIDSVYISPGGSLAMKLHEAAKSNLTLGQGDATGPMIFNLDTWNSLPGDIQDVMMEASLETAQWSLGFLKETNKRAHQIFRDSGLYVGPAPEKDSLKLFKAIMKYTIEEQWANDAKTAGVGDEAQILLKYWKDLAYGPEGK